MFVNLASDVLLHSATYSFFVLHLLLVWYNTAATTTITANQHHNAYIIPYHILCEINKKNAWSKKNEM